MVKGKGMAQMKEDRGKKEKMEKQTATTRRRGEDGKGKEEESEVDQGKDGADSEVALQMIGWIWD